MLRFPTAADLLETMIGTVKYILLATMACVPENARW